MTNWRDSPTVEIIYSDGERRIAPMPKGGLENLTQEFWKEAINPMSAIPLWERIALAWELGVWK